MTAKPIIDARTGKPLTREDFERGQAMTTHTPGPWVNGGPWIKTKEGLGIAVCSASPNRSMDSACANARLAAQAPNLLKALEYFFAAGEFLPTKFGIEQARKAIAAASTPKE